MDWIKKNPAKLTLAVVALLVIAASALLYSKVSSFSANFDAARNSSVSSAPVPKLDTAAIDKATAEIGATVAWQLGKESGKLLVSKFYVARNGVLEKPEGTIFHPPVPNDWLRKYGLDELNPGVLDSDPDQDGFTTREEFFGLDAVSHLDMNGQPVMGPDGRPLPDDSTDPTKADSHPPYHTKLELARVSNIPFRLRVMSIDVPPNFKSQKEITVGINTVDLRNRTHFIAVGDDIPGTTYKVESYEHKEAPDKDGTSKDVSEVTVLNKETNEKVILPLRQVVDSPDSRGVFRYKWVQPGGKATEEFQRRRGETFELPPEKDKTYKVEQIKGNTAVIILPGGAKKTLTAP